MPIEEIKDDKPLDLEPKFGIASVGSGVLAILLVWIEYEVLMYVWSGHESQILSMVFCLLPPTTIGLAIAGIVFGQKGLKEEGIHRALGVIGTLVSVLPFMLCCLLFVFFFVASGGLVGF